MSSPTSPRAPKGTPSQVVDAAIDAVAKLDAALHDSAEQAGPIDPPQPALVREPFNMRAPRLIEPVAIQLDKTRHLRLPFWALKLFEEKTGLSAWDNDKVFAWPPKLGVIVTLLWCALLDEDPDLTIERVERMPGLEFGQIYYVLNCLDECWGRNAPAPDPAPDGHERPDPNPAAGLPTG
jgi:hypothetical protein